MLCDIKIIPNSWFTLYEEGGSALRGVSGNFPGKASPSTVVSTFLMRYWLVVCEERTLSAEEEEPGYQDARHALLSRLPSLKPLGQRGRRVRTDTYLHREKNNIFDCSNLNARRDPYTKTVIRTIAVIILSYRKSNFQKFCVSVENMNAASSKWN